MVSAIRRELSEALRRVGPHKHANARAPRFRRGFAILMRAISSVTQGGIADLADIRSQRILDVPYA